MKIICYNGGAVYYPATQDEVNWCIQHDIFPYSIEGGFIHKALNDYMNMYFAFTQILDEDGEDRYNYNFDLLIQDNVFFDVNTLQVRDRIVMPGSLSPNPDEEGLLPTYNLNIPKYAIYELNVNQGHALPVLLYSINETDILNNPQIENFLKQKPIPIHLETTIIAEELVNISESFKSNIDHINGIEDLIQQEVDDVNALSINTLNEVFNILLAMGITIDALSAILGTTSQLNQLVTNTQNLYNIARNLFNQQKNARANNIQFLLNQIMNNTEDVNTSIQDINRIIEVIQEK